MKTPQEILKQKVEFVIKKFGYETSYAKNMLCAIGQSETNSDYKIQFDLSVCYTEKDVVLQFTKTNQFIKFRELIWNLNELVGEYILNENEDYFDEK